MPRYTTVLIGILVFFTLGAVVLSLFAFEQNRQINDNLRNLGEDFYTNRVKLFATPVDLAGGKEFDKIDRLKWYEIRLEMLKYRREIESLEMRCTNCDLVAIALFATSFIAIMIYSPALWVAEFRFGNEIEKFIFNSSVGLMMFVGTAIRLYAYFFISKSNYNKITAIARPVVERVGEIKLPYATHFCYFGSQAKRSLQDEQLDAHWVSAETHQHLEKVAAAATYCHPELLDLLLILFSTMSVIVHLLLFVRTTRLGKSYLELLNEMETVENIVQPAGDSSDDDMMDINIGSTKNEGSHGESSKKKSMLPDRNPKNAFYAEDNDEKYNEKEESMMETLMDADQLRELREIYLTNYAAPNKNSTKVLKPSKK